MCPLRITTVRFYSYFIAYIRYKNALGATTVTALFRLKIFDIGRASLLHLERSTSAGFVLRIFPTAQNLDTFREIYSDLQNIPLP